MDRGKSDSVTTDLWRFSSAWAWELPGNNSFSLANMEKVLVPTEAAPKQVLASLFGRLATYYGRGW